MRITRFGHFRQTAAPHDSLTLLGPSKDGNYLFRFEDGQKISIAISQIRLLSPAAQAATEASQCLYDLTGQVLRFNSGYRSLLDQIRVFRSSLKQVNNNFSDLIRRVAPPGYSEHHTGLAIDISNGLDVAPKLLPFFGWEKSFPPNNAQGLQHEAWHWRYTGKDAISAALANPSLANSPYRNHGTINLIAYDQPGFQLQFDSPIEYDKPVGDPILYIAECLLELSQSVPEHKIDNYNQAILQKGVTFLETLGIKGVNHLDAISLALEIYTALLPGERGERVKRLQKQLARLGLFHSPTTGYYGVKTAEAVSQFYRLSGRPDPGFVDVDMLRSLRVRAVTALELIPINRLSEVVNGQWVNGLLPSNGLSLMVNGRYSCQPTTGELIVASCAPEGWNHLEKFSRQAHGAEECTFLVDTNELYQSFQFPILKVSTTRRAIGLLAHQARLLLRGKVIAITGSSGKTTTKEILRNILSTNGVTVATPGTANSLMAICYHLLNWSIHADYYVCECGLSAAGSSIDQQSNLLKPDIAIVTSVHAAHTEGYESIEQVARKKVEIAKYLNANGCLFLDGESAYLNMMVEMAREWGVKNILTFGYSPGCTARIVYYETRGLNGYAKLEILGVVHDLTLQMPGRHWAQTAMIVLACCQLLGLAIQPVLDQLSTVQLPSGRGTIIGCPGDTIVIFDSHYNANPGSMCADLEAYAGINLPKYLKRVGVIGSMKELGQFSDTGHLEIIKPIRSAGFSRLLLVGEESCKLIDAFPEIIVSAHQTADEVIKSLQRELIGNEFVFVKGSHANDLEKVIKYLREVNHGTLR